VAHPFFDVANPIVLGHRGAAGHAPENTLLSFERAIALGADVIESDVQVTRDGVPVLLHDDVVDRVTNGVGSVDAFTLEELQALDAGHHFDIGDRGNTSPVAPTRFRGRGLRVPSLQEAFEAFPRAHFNLEIKTGAAGVVARVIELVAKFERAPTTLLTAADDDIMVSIRSELASRGVGTATSASVSEVVAVVQSAVSGVDPPSGIMALQIPMTFGDAPLVTPALVAHARLHGIHLHVWTINDRSQMDELLDLGVDGLVTDFPDRAVRTIELRRRS
jgi:glycerophosphoryl diester phosphodiesterase